MNFTTQVLEGLEDFKKLGDDLMVMECLARSLVAAHKYVVPEPRAIKTRVTGNSAKFIKMPFHEVVIEYAVPDASDACAIPDLNQTLTKSSRRVALCVDMKNSTSHLARVLRAMIHDDPMLPKVEIAVIGFYYVDAHKGWQPAMGFATWGIEWAVDFDNDGVSQALKYGIHPLMRETIMDCVQRGYLDPRTLSDVFRNDIHEDIGHALRMLALINARNLKTLKVIEAPVALNAKRAKKNKPPFFEYHTLDIFLTGNVPQRRKKLPSIDEVRKMLVNGKKALHEVTGHFKVRSTGVFWWNPFVRGTKDVGEVKSTHSVHKEKT